MGSKYITVMYSTVPLFLSIMWVEYLEYSKHEGDGGNGKETERLKILVNEKDGSSSYGFFRNVQGRSWHAKDVEINLGIGRHKGLVAVFGFVLGCSVS